MTLARVAPPAPLRVPVTPPAQRAAAVSTQRRRPPLCAFPVLLEPIPPRTALPVKSAQMVTQARWVVQAMLASVLRAVARPIPVPLRPVCASLVLLDQFPLELLRVAVLQGALIAALTPTKVAQAVLGAPL